MRPDVWQKLHIRQARDWNRDALTVWEIGRLISLIVDYSVYAVGNS